jgi:hypothetical protein
MGTQSAPDRAAGVAGCSPKPHLKGLQADSEAAPGVSVLPLSGQGMQDATEALPSAVEKVLRGQGKQGAPSRGWYVPAMQRAQLVFDTDAALAVVKPRGHSAQAVEPGAKENFPAPHSSHAANELLPVKGLKVPSGHGRHAPLVFAPASGLYLPLSQLAHSAAPAALYFPDSHVAHEADATLLEEPAGHFAHASAAPPAPLKVPAGQSLHEEEFAALHEPGEQGRHWVTDAMPGKRLYVLAGQAEHCAAPETELNLPVGHSTHTPPQEGLNFPGGHAAQRGEVGGDPRGKAGSKPAPQPLQAVRLAGTVNAPAPAPLQQRAEPGAV